MVNVRLLLGLLGVLLEAVSSEFNDQVTGGALTDIRGALGISHDPGTWLESLYIAAEVIGMMSSPWWLVTISLRRFSLFVVALNCASSVLIAFVPNVQAFYVLRVFQGLAGGLSIPLLMTTALRALPPPIRLYGLAAYAMTATFTPNLASSLAALWTEYAGWRGVFLEVIPFCALSFALIFYGLPQDPPQYQRIRQFPLRGFVLGVLGFCSMATMLIQGDRLDWFNNRMICVMALLSAVCIPLFLLDQWFHKLPFIKLQLLGRPNLAYGCVALLLFLIINLSSSSVPSTYLTEVQGYRPIQAFYISLEVALAQLVLLPVMAVILNFERVDSRVVSFIGLSCILAACIGDSFIDSSWDREQFYLWQGLQAVGEPMVVMPLLLMATNSLVPQEGPFASALVNTPRAIAEAAGIWLIDLIQRWRGSLHSDRLADRAGRVRFSLIDGGGPVSHADGLLRTGMPAHGPGAMQALAGSIRAEAAVLTLSDAFVVLACVTAFLMLILLILPVRTYPPRIVFAKK